MTAHSINYCLDFRVHFRPVEIIRNTTAGLN